MELSNKTAREIYYEIKANPQRAKFGFGKRPAIVNIDLQRAYTDTATFKTAYETDPRQIEYINEINRIARSKNIPVIFTYVAYMDSGEDAGVWGTRTNTPDSLQNIKFGSERAEFDKRLVVDAKSDVIYCKKMPSPFFETPLGSLLTWHQVDTVIITGGSTSGCVRAAAVDSLSRGYRTIVPEECVADKHESYHFANLTDMLLKYADVEPVQAVIDYLNRLPVLEKRINEFLNR
ncbi:isochorismatase family protein [Rhodoflexus caldus]|uniref:isochorismatase family protein n=1 Tax=Rhodoflexus caldus TaxID=2891236 RepID=UPI00202AB475|nr:isochorismatase family protein [Rhodoflexus caldus]